MQAQQRRRRRKMPNVHLDIAVDDLAFIAADAIARPVTAELRATTPLMRRLEEAAGDALTRQMHVHEPLDIGAAVVTVAGAIEAGLMIHAVVMTEDEPVSKLGVQRATTSALQRANDWKIDRLAFAPFGLGAGNLEVEDAAQAMLMAISDHAGRAVFPKEITIVVENDFEAEAFRAAKRWRWSGE
ncbi:MAG: macro domain-containing protein [Gemmatimonadaceae bacterium]